MGPIRRYLKKYIVVTLLGNQKKRFGCISQNWVFTLILTRECLAAYYLHEHFCANVQQTDFFNQCLIIAK